MGVEEKVIVDAKGKSTEINVFCVSCSISERYLRQKFRATTPLSLR